MWFVAPSFLDADKPSAHDDAHEVVEWASRGGTAVIFGEPGSNWKVLGLMREASRARTMRDGRFIKGDLRPRRDGSMCRTCFTSPHRGKRRGRLIHERVRLTADGKPFALEMVVGKNGGRIIAIADDNFLRNEHLADADASLVVVDLVHEFGAPVFDEHSHGLAPPSSLTFAILDSRAILPIAHRTAGRDAVGFFAARLAASLAR